MNRAKEGMQIYPRFLEFSEKTDQPTVSSPSRGGCEIAEMLHSCHSTSIRLLSSGKRYFDIKIMSSNSWSY